MLKVETIRLVGVNTPHQGIHRLVWAPLPMLGVYILVAQEKQNGGH